MTAQPQRMPSLDHVWLNTVVEWNKPASHDELLRIVTVHAAWAWAARLYRDYLEEHPGDVIAQQQLRKIQCAIVVTMGTPRSRRRTGPYRATRNVMKMLVVGLTMGTIYTTVLDRSDDELATSSLSQPLDVGRCGVDEDGTDVPDDCNQIVRADPAK
jgi:hypothetical protein